MADIVVKNGYNGFKNNKRFKEKNHQKNSMLSNKLPPLERRENGFISTLEASFSPEVQPSISISDRTTTATGDIVILLDDEIRRIRQLSIHLGLNHRYEVAQYHNRFQGRGKPDKLPKIESSKSWIQSHNWIKRMENGSRLDLQKNDLALAKKIFSPSVDLDSLPKGRKKLLEPVNIPALGCSYRLPVIKKHTRTTRR